MESRVLGRNILSSTKSNKISGLKDNSQIGSKSYIAFTCRKKIQLFDFKSLCVKIRIYPYLIRITAHEKKAFGSSLRVNTPFLDFK